MDCKQENKDSSTAPCFDRLPVSQVVLLPFKITSKRGVLANVAVWNATAGLLHQLHGVSIQRPGDLETKEPLHLSELQAE